MHDIMSKKCPIFAYDILTIIRYVAIILIYCNHRKINVDYYFNFQLKYEN